MTTRGPRGSQPLLAGPVVRLRPWQAEDAAAVFAACQDPEIQRWTQVPVPYGAQDAEGFVRGIAPATWAEGGGLFAVEAAEGGTPDRQRAAERHRSPRPAGRRSAALIHRASDLAPPGGGRE